MNQLERLALCSKCINRRLDHEHGYVCQLNGRFADFTDKCKHYVLDSTVNDTIKVRTKDRPFVPLFDPPPVQQARDAKKKSAKRKAVPRRSVQRNTVTRKELEQRAAGQHRASRKKLSELARKKLWKYQSFLYALIGGLLITATAAAAWAFITAMTGYQGVYMALGVGLLVGIAVRFFGAGIKWVFGILAALLAVAGSLMGYYLSQYGFVEDLQLAGIMELPEYLDQGLMINTIRDSFVPLDLLFYGLAALLAYVLAIRRISSKKRSRLEDEAYKGAPVLYWLRLPLIIALILLPAYYAYTLTAETPVEFQTSYYESGEKKSEGEMRDGKESGLWTSWYETGTIQSTGYYLEGRKDSLWMWYDESGVLKGSGMYDRDMQHGTWMNYHPNGTLADSGAYLGGLQEGLWKYFHGNGRLKYAVPYKAGKMHGEKVLLSPSGTVVNVAYFENGVQVEKDQ